VERKAEKTIAVVTAVIGLVKVIADIFKARKEKKEEEPK
jgi:hypothetical protein